jgi:hypothetical protein
MQIPGIPRIGGGSGGGGLSEPLALEQQLITKGRVFSGIDGTGTVFQTLGGGFYAYAPSADGTDFGAVTIAKTANAGGYNGNLLVEALTKNQTFRFGSGNASVPLASGAVLGTITGPYTFNGNTGGATTETTIMTSTLPANTAAPGHQVALAGTLNLSGVNGADTLTVKVKRGASTILEVALAVADLVTPPSYITLQLSETFQSIGAAGNLYRYGAITASVASDLDISNATIDTTASNAYSVTAQWSSNNAGNTAVFMNLNVVYKLA